MTTIEHCRAPTTDAVPVRSRVILRRLHSRLLDGGPAERGDVPGWVLVTLMSALLVVTLLGVARGELVSVFRNAIDSVANP